MIQNPRVDPFRIAKRHEVACDSCGKTGVEINLNRGSELCDECYDAADAAWLEARNEYEKHDD